MTTRGRIVIDLFTTLDGVAQAPGAPDEDTSDGFRFGGWQAPFPDDMVGEQVSAYIDTMDALLLGRRTYDIFAAYWPFHIDGPAGAIGRTFTRVPKYVASRGTVDASWEGTRQLGADVLGEIDALRDVHRDIHVVGSLGLANALLDAGVFDELRLWVHPSCSAKAERCSPPARRRRRCASSSRRWSAARASSRRATRRRAPSPSATWTRSTSPAEDASRGR